MIRSGICLQDIGGSRHLLFAYMPSADTSSMTRLFQAYRCTTAMQLDINLSRVGFLPFIKQDPEKGIVGKEFLHKVGDSGDNPVPFVDANDYRDFFYILSR